MITLTTVEMDRTLALDAVCSIIKSDSNWFHRRVVSLFEKGMQKAKFEHMEALSVWLQNGLSIAYYEEVPRSATCVPRVYTPSDGSPMRLTWEYREIAHIELFYSSDSAYLRLTHDSQKLLAEWQQASRLHQDHWITA